MESIKERCQSLWHHLICVPSASNGGRDEKLTEKKGKVPEKRAQNTQKEHAKILRNKANGFVKVRLSLRLLSLRSNRFRLLVAKRKKRGKRVKVLIVQLCLGVVPRCAALAMATSLFVIVQLFIRALDGL